MLGKVQTVTIALVAVALVLGGCRKQESTLEDIQEPQVEADTTFSEPAPMQEIDTTDEAVFREADLDAEMERMVQEKLKPVYFEYNSFALTPEATENLADAASFLNEYPQVRILIEGNCDERGSTEYNLALGENRARAVKNYLSNYGIDRIRMEITSWGEERPVQIGCSDEACHSLNRRAEFKVLQR